MSAKEFADKCLSLFGVHATIKCNAACVETHYSDTLTLNTETDNHGTFWLRDTKKKHQNEDEYTKSVQHQNNRNFV